ncbi:MAG: GspH/FimT family pseudopilin [Gammaproteobacteria bacterium]|nr:GspH/FimT family pseudopilin [Gammaproteobacteria bacterium]
MSNAKQRLIQIRVVTNDQRAFTLIELLVTIAIATIIMAIAVPSMTSFLGNNRVAATTNTLVHSLQTARAEAIKRSSPVGLCTTNTPTDPAASCDAGAGYSSGWIVYSDDDRNGSRTAGEAIIHSSEAVSPAFAFTPTLQLSDQVYFNDSGGSVTPVGLPISGSINISYAGGEEVRNVLVSANGRISTETP